MGFIVKNTTFPSLLDLLAPHSCRGCGAIGEPLCECCKNNIIKSRHNFCPRCKKPNKNGLCKSKTCKTLPPTFIVDTRENLIGTLVHDFKYNSVRALARPIAELLDSSLPQINGDVVVVPLPTIAKHVRARGLDHTYLIAKNLARIRHIEAARLIIRAKDTVQVGADEKSRKIQAKDAYEVSASAALDKDTTYILLDDVWTTGASMEAATKKLREAGASKIIVAILAVSKLN